MSRQLFFLLPDVDHTQRTIRDLVQSGIGQNQMHVIVRDGTDTSTLPGTIREAADFQRDKREQFVWNCNLMVFFVALTAALYLLASASPYYAVIPLFFMFVCFMGGKYVVEKLPSTHLSNFQGAINHGEVLLIVDLPKSHVKEMASLIQRKHPEAVNGGMDWKLATIHNH